MKKKEKVEKIRVEKKVEEVLQQKSMVQPVTNLTEIVKKVYENRFTPEELLMVGEAIKMFKLTDMMCILVGAIEYVVNAELDKDQRTGENADQCLGIQRGARRVLTTIIGIENKALIKNMELDRMNKVKEEEDLIDAEDLNPKAQTGKGGVGI